MKNNEVAHQVYRHLAYVKNGVRSGLIVTMPYLFYDAVMNEVIHVGYYDAIKLNLEERFIYMDMVRYQHMEIYQKCLTASQKWAKILKDTVKEFNFLDQPKIEEPGDTILEINNKLIGR